MKVKAAFAAAAMSMSVAACGLSGSSAPSARTTPVSPHAHPSVTASPRAHPRTAPGTTAPRPKVVLQASGNGNRITQTFTVFDYWDLSYNYDCSGQTGDFAVNIYYADGTVDSSGAKVSGTKGSDVVHVDKGGNFYLDVVTGCAWWIDVGSPTEPTETTPSPEASSDGQAPTATFTVSCTDLSCTFDGTGSTDPDGTINSYAWNFGDGTTDTTPTPTHNYASGGSYDVSLIVTDDQGNSSTPSTQSVTATEPKPAPNQPPTAAFTVLCTDLSCTFDGGGSTDPDGTINSYAWNFGDGTTDTSPTPTHNYIGGGNYEVSLVVTDDQGTSSTATTQSVTVTEPATQPTPEANQPPTDSGPSLSEPTTIEPVPTP